MKQQRDKSNYKFHIENFSHAIRSSLPSLNPGWGRREGVIMDAAYKMTQTDKQFERQWWWITRKITASCLSTLFRSQNSTVSATWDAFISEINKVGGCGREMGHQGRGVSDVWPWCLQPRTPPALTWGWARWRAAAASRYNSWCRTARSCNTQQQTHNWMERNTHVSGCLADSVGDWSLFKD